MIYAMFCTVLLTLVIGVITLYVRVRSVQSGSVKIKYYRTMQGQDAPEFVIRTSRCFSNMFEVPVLFYVVATLYISLNVESGLAIALAWIFVALRVGHTVIHLTYNNVLHRMLSFWGGAVSVLLMWVVLIASLD